MLEDRSRAYLGFLESLTRERVAELPAYCREDVRFTDPFNDVVGITAYQGVLAKMFDDLDGATFQVSRIAFGDQGICFAEWRFAYRTGGRSTWHPIDGASAIEFDENGLVMAHRDYWDAASQLYERQPLIGPVLRALRRRIAYS